MAIKATRPTKGENIKNTITEVEEMPIMKRDRKRSELLEMITQGLTRSLENNTSLCLDNVEPGKGFNSMSQRIRTQSKKMNINVTIRYVASENKLYFKSNKTM